MMAAVHFKNIHILSEHEASDFRSQTRQITLRIQHYDKMQILPRIFVSILFQLLTI